VSDYDWFCPSCGNRISWNEEGAYSDRIDDTVCLECAITEEEKNDENTTGNHATDDLINSIG
jgi:hypothetical protein